MAKWRLAVAVSLHYFQCCRGGIIDLSTNETITPYVTPLYSSFIEQNLSIANAQSVKMTHEKLKQLCSLQNHQQVKDISSIWFAYHIVFRLSPWRDRMINFLLYWCEIPVQGIVFMNPSWYPGFLANLRYGEFPNTISKPCALYEAFIDSPTWYPSNQTRNISFQFDENESLAMLETLWCVLMFKFVSFCICK